MIISKVRGQKRKLSTFKHNLINQTEIFPKEDKKDCGYWHLHIPIARDFIDSKNTSTKIRRTIIQTLISRTEHLIKLKPNNTKTRVVTAINLPYIFDSQIVVFFGDNYFNNFFERDSDEQRWIALSENRSLKSEWSLIYSDSLIECGYKEIIKDEDYIHEGEIWFVGELK